MKLLQILVLSIFLPFSAFAQDVEPLVAVEAHGVTMAEFKWRHRPVVVFAESDQNPEFTRQLELLAERPEALRERDVVVIIDAQPNPQSEFRKTLRPRGFSLVILDKDGEVEIRKPRAWTVREIVAAIDKFPLMRLETLEKFPGGM